MNNFFFSKFIAILLICLSMSCHYNTTNTTKTTKMKSRFNFYTQYNQFYISSDNAKSLVSDNSWKDEMLTDRLGLLNNTLVVNTESYGDIKGELIVLENGNNDINYDIYDHIVEGGIEIKSGILNILDCPNTTSQLEINLKPGKYRIRIYSSNLNSVKENDLANDSDQDFYKIEVWPDDNMELKILKRFVRK